MNPTELIFYHSIALLSLASTLVAIGLIKKSRKIVYIGIIGVLFATTLPHFHKEISEYINGKQ